MKRVLTLAVTLWIATSPVFSQARTVASPKFEVVSVKPTKSAGGPIVLDPELGGRFIATNETVRGLLRFAFFVFRPMDDSQIVGGPQWVTSDRFDIQAQANGPLGYDDMSIAVRAMLEDRFHLQVHREARDRPVYNLVIAKDGPKMKAVTAPPPLNPTEAPPPAPPRPGANATFTPPPGMIFRGLNNVIGSAIQIEQIVSVLASFLGRPVIDKTDLKGYFDLRLEFAPQGTSGNRFSPGTAGGQAVRQAAASDPQGPSIFTAVQEQLGLRLESSRGASEVIVIDGVQKPSEN